MMSTPAQVNAQTRAYRYVVFAMVVTITAINYIDRGAISYAANSIIGEFGFSTASWGSVLGFFGYGYMLGALLGGALADRLGPRRVWVWAVLAWSVVEMSTAYAGDIGKAMFAGSALVGFAVVRVAFGFTEGPLFSTTNRTMANWATVRERGLAASLGLLGTPVGSVLTAPVAVALLALTHSWRVLFIALGILGLAWVLVWTRLFTDMPEDNPRVTSSELSQIRSTNDLVAGEHSLATDTAEPKLRWWRFFASPTLVFNAVGYFAFQYVNFMILTWTPKYLQDQFHFSLTSLWWLGTIPWLGACVTVVLGGRLSDWLRQRTGNLWVARSGLALVSMVLTAACFSVIPMLHHPAAALVLMAVGNALNFLPNSVYWTVVIDTVPRHAGAYGGITHFIANIATVAAPTLTGLLVAQHGYGAMFVATAVASGLGALCMVFVRPGKVSARRAPWPG